MSRVDLDRIQAQLKVAIQSHQLLVAKMKSDPQNIGLQKQLHDLQSEITSLSEKQKSVVQHLRKELVNKPSDIRYPPSPAMSPVQPLPAHVKLQSPIMPVNIAPNHVPFQSKALPLLAPKGPAPNNHQMAVPHKASSKGTHQGCVGPAKVDLSNANNLNNNNLTQLPVSGSPTTKFTSAPLRIPQITGRPSILQGGSRHVMGRTPSSSLVPVSARRGSEADYGSLRKASISKDATPEERKKLEFMASLDLITPDTLKDLQTRRSERKRRSTANPQFSYGHFEPERKRAAATYLSQVPPQPGVRRRGRPPKNRAPVERCPATPTATTPVQE